jgi:DNA replication protein DnaC
MITPGSEKFDWQFKTCNDAQLEAVLKAAKRFASAIQLKADPHWLCLFGKSGTGKTHLAKQLLAFWRRCGGWRNIEGKAGTIQSLGNSRLVSFPKFIERQKGGSYGEIDDIREFPFVVIDDLGAEHDPSGFAKSRAFDIAEGRLGKWTVFTSNLTLKQLAEHDARIASRMLRGGSVRIELTCTDFNLRKPPQNETPPS